MSQDIATLQIKVKANDTRSATADLKKLGYQAGVVEDKTTKAAKSTKLLTKATVSLGLSVAGVTLLVKNSIRQWIAYDTKMKEVRSISGLTAKQFASVRTELLGVSAELGVASDDIASAAYQAVSAGVAAKDTARFMRDAGTLAKAGVASTEEAVDLLTTAINAYGFETTKATELGDKFFTAVKLGKTTISELAATFGQAAPLAATLGISVDEVLSSLVVMTKQGIVTTEAVTKLTAIMSSMVKPSSELADVMHKLGYANGQAMLDANGLQGSLELLNEAVGGDTAAMSKLFPRIESVTGVLASLAQDGKLAKGAMDGLKESTNNMGEAAKTNSVTLDTLLTKFKALAVLQAERGEGFAGAYSGTLKYFDYILKGGEATSKLAEHEASMQRTITENVKRQAEHRERNLSNLKATADVLGIEFEKVKNIENLHLAINQSFEGRTAHEKALLIYLGNIDTEYKHQYRAILRLAEAENITVQQAERRLTVTEYMKEVQARELSQAKDRLKVADEEAAEALRKSELEKATADLAKVMVNYKDGELETARKHVAVIEARMVLEGGITDEVRTRLAILKDEIKELENAARVRGDLATGKLSDPYTHPDSPLNPSNREPEGRGSGSTTSTTNKFQDEAKQLAESLASQNESLLEQSEREQTMLDEAYARKLLSQEEYSEASRAITERLEADRMSLLEQSRQLQLNLTYDLFSSIANLAATQGKKGAKVAKALTIATITLKSIEATQSAYSSGIIAGAPYNSVPTAIAYAAIAGAAGAANIAAAAATPVNSFAGGGIVGGSSYVGDSVGVNVNSAEMILNRNQQARLFSQLNGSSQPNSSSPTVNIINQTNESVEGEVQESSNGDISIVIRQAVDTAKSELADEVRNGYGEFAPSLEQTFALRRGLT